MTRTVRLIERSEVSVSPDEWAGLSAEPDFWNLVEGGIVDVKQVSPTRVHLRGNAYVGQARVGDMSVVVSEKIPGALASLIRFATSDAFRVEPLSAAASDPGQLFRLLVTSFLTAVVEYLARGRDFEYQRVNRVGSFVRGRLDVTRTVGLRARGLGHLVGFSHDVLSHATLKNRIILAALRSLEVALPGSGLDSSQIARARGLAMMFADSRDAEVLFREPAFFGDHAERELENEVRDRDLLALATVILSRISFELNAQDPLSVPRAWFLNLEQLFEAAVRRVLGGLLGRDNVQRGIRARRRVLAGATDQYRADPDLVVTGVGPPTVGDVKYKTWSGWPTAADVYQLLVHAAAFDADEAFLIYPDTAYEVRRAGRAVTGPSAIFFSVDVRNLDRDIRLACLEIGLDVEQALPDVIAIRG